MERSRIPEYVDAAFSDDRAGAANYAHEESSALAKRAMQAAFENGYNCTLDGTGDGKIESLRSKLEYAHRMGYRVNGVYVTCPTDVAVERNAGRSQTDTYNRMVPESEVRKIHRNVSSVFPQIASEFDHVDLYDTTTKPPTKIAECNRGQEIKVLDQKKYDDFLAKAKE